MARFEVGVSQIDDKVIARIKAAHDVGGNAKFDAVLESAGERLAEYFRGALSQMGIRKTGQLIESVKPTKAKAGKNGAKYVDVYPQGIRAKESGRKKPVSNAMVGYAHEYGVMRVPPKKSTPARHWMSNTVDDVGEEIQDAVTQGLNEIFNNELGG